MRVKGVFVGLGLVLASGLLVAAAHAQAGCTSDTSARKRSDAQRLREEHRDADAFSGLKEYLDRCPSDLEVARVLADTALQRGDAAYADALLRNILLKQNDSDLHTLLAIALDKEKRPKDAASEFQIAATMEPSETHVFDFGTALMKVDFGAAQQILTFGVSTYPQSIRLRVALALAFLAQDRSEEAATILCAAADLDPSDPHPMEILADTANVPKSLQGEIARRLESLRQSDPKSGLLLFDEIMVKSGLWSGLQGPAPLTLIPALRQALVLDPTLAKAHYEIALLRQRSQQYGDAIAELKVAIRLEPRVAKYHYRLASLYRVLGDTAHTREELHVYLALANPPSAA